MYNKEKKNHSIVWSLNLPSRGWLLPCHVHRAAIVGFCVKTKLKKKKILKMIFFFFSGKNQETKKTRRQCKKKVDENFYLWTSAKFNKCCRSRASQHCIEFGLLTNFAACISLVVSCCDFKLIKTNVISQFIAHTFIVSFHQNKVYKIINFMWRLINFQCIVSVSFLSADNLLTRYQMYKHNRPPEHS